MITKFQRLQNTYILILQQYMYIVQARDLFVTEQKLSFWTAFLVVEITADISKKMFI